MPLANTQTQDGQRRAVSKSMPWLKSQNVSRVSVCIWLLNAVYQVQIQEQQQAIDCITIALILTILPTFWKGPQ